jgi:hypothetical protein
MPVSDTFVISIRRPMDGEAVACLAASMKEIGLQHPITIRLKSDVVDPTTVRLEGTHPPGLDVQATCQSFVTARL